MASEIRNVFSTSQLIEFINRDVHFIEGFVSARFENELQAKAVRNRIDSVRKLLKEIGERETSIGMRAE